jgi:hypothetical protein
VPNSDRKKCRFCTELTSETAHWRRAWSFLYRPVPQCRRKKSAVRAVLPPSMIPLNRVAPPSAPPSGSTQTPLLARLSAAWRALARQTDSAPRSDSGPPGNCSRRYDQSSATKLPKPVRREFGLRCQFGQISHSIRKPSQNRAPSGRSVRQLYDGVGFYDGTEPNSPVFTTTIRETVRSQKSS